MHFSSLSTVNKLTLKTALLAQEKSLSNTMPLYAADCPAYEALASELVRTQSLLAGLEVDIENDFEKRTNNP